jgi:membrane protein YdbS with pleckstrin-like domain
MLNGEEKEFIVFWEANRLRQRRFVKYLQYGLPMGVAIGIAIFANLLSGWYKRATMIINAEPSLIIVLLLALIIIVIFIAVFTVHHRWEINEQRYRELLVKKEKE